MGGHSHWSQVKRQKGAADAKRGQVFTKLGREISVAARQGGPDPVTNFRLRLAVQRARDSNMPNDTIDRAIKRGAGGPDAAELIEATYEGYGPGGVAVLVEVATDNRNRTVAEVRSIFTKAGGQLASSGAVAWQFEQRGVISVPRAGADPDEVALLAIDAGAIDVETSTDPLEIYTEPGDLEAVQAALVGAGVAIESADGAMIAKQTMAVDASRARQNLRLVEHLEDLDDVQRVTSNLELTDEILAEVAG